MIHNAAPYASLLSTPKTFLFSIRTQISDSSSKQSSALRKAAVKCPRWGHLRERSPRLRRCAPAPAPAQAAAQIHASAGMTRRLNITIAKASAHFPHWALTTASIRVRISLTQINASSHSYTYETTLSLVTSSSIPTAGLLMTAGTKAKDWRKTGTGLQLNTWVLPTWTDKQCPEGGNQAPVPTHYNDGNGCQ